MKAVEITDSIPFKQKDGLIKVLLYIKLSDKNYKLSDNDLSVLSLFNSTDDKEKVINDSLSRGYIKSFQSGENCITRLVNFGILQKVGKKKRIINPNVLPSLQADIIVSKLVLHNASE